MSLNTQELLNVLGHSDLNINQLLANPNLDCILGQNNDVRPLIVKEQYLYTHRTLTTEISLAQKIQVLLKAPVTNSSYSYDSLLADSVLTLNEEQQEAVLLALQNNLALITGGPGTGKTFVLATIIITLVNKLKMDVEKLAIAAPTGRAAQRISDTMQAILAQLTDHSHNLASNCMIEPKTIHRLLSWHPIKLQFNHNENNPIDAKVVIIDEASMVSQELMDQTLKAIAPGTKIILLGDADQLPSIDGGCTFRDMVLTLNANTKKLTKNYRMLSNNPEGHAIMSLAQAINLETNDHALNPSLYQLQASKDWLGSKVELIDEDDLGIFLNRWFQECVVGCNDFFTLVNRVYNYHEDCTWALEDEEALKTLFTHFDKFRILCVLKNANKLRGAKEINKIMHNWMYLHTGFGLQHEVTFFSGEPVMMTVNDYKRGIFNGDQGLILKVAFDGHVCQTAIFPDKDKFRALPLSDIKNQLELCYAMTVHKAQGSEYDKVAIVLPNTINHPAITRELLYTAVTRARKSVTLLSSYNQLTWAIKNNIKRDTGLKNELHLSCDGVITA